MTEHMSILLDKLKKLGTGDMDGPSVMLLESPDPTQDLLAVLASEFAPKSADNLRIYFGLRNVTDLHWITDDEIAGCYFLTEIEKDALRKLCSPREWERTVEANI